MITIQGQPLLERTSERLHGAPRGRVARAVAEAMPQVVAETLVRLAISHAALPDGRPAEAAGNVAEILGPYLEQLCLSTERSRSARLSSFAAARLIRLGPLSAEEGPCELRSSDQGSPG